MLGAGTLLTTKCPAPGTHRVSNARDFPGGMLAAGIDFSFCIVYLSFYEVGNLSKLFNFCSAGIINAFFQIQDGGQLLCTVSKFKAFSSRCAFENVGNGTKTDLLSNTNTVECKGLE